MIGTRGFNVHITALAAGAVNRRLSLRAGPDQAARSLVAECHVGSRRPERGIEPQERMLAEKLNKVNAHDPSRGQAASMWTAEGHLDVGLALIERGTDVVRVRRQNSPRCSTGGAR